MMDDDNFPPNPHTNNTTRTKEFTCNHQGKHITQKIREFYTTNEFFDTYVISGIDNSRFPAHKLILSASSDYFLATFRANLKESESFEIRFETLDGPTIKLILDFIYTGTVQINNDNIENLLQAAGFLQMDSLLTACCEFTGEQLDASNCLGIALFAEQHSYKGLAEKAFAYVAANFEKVTSEAEFFQLNVEQISRFLASDHLCVSSEENVYLSLVSWLNHDKHNRVLSLYGLLTHIRFIFLKPKFIIENCDHVCQTIGCNELIRSWLKWHLSEEFRSTFEIQYNRPRKSQFDLLIVAGYESSKFEFHTYNYALNQWTRQNWPKPDKLIAGCGSIVVNKKLFLVGGEIHHNIQMDTVDCLDLETLEWSELPRMNEPRRWPDMVVIDHYIYAIGGAQWCSMERYNLITCHWEELCALPLKSDIGVEIAAIDGKIYVTMSDSCSLHCYDPDTDEWTAKASKFVKVKYIGMAALRGCLYVIGGTFIDDEIIVTDERYDPKTDKWTVCSPSRVRRSQIRCVAFNDRLLAVGGHDENGAVDLVEEFNPDTNEWKILGPKLSHETPSNLMLVR